MEMSKKRAIQKLSMEMSTNRILSDLEYQNGHKEYNFRCTV